MRTLISLFTILACVSLTTIAEAKGVRGGSHSVRGYVKKNGTYVQPHRSTNSNSTKIDNWSTRGNVNPYTGQAGTKPAF